MMIPKPIKQETSISGYMKSGAFFACKSIKNVASASLQFSSQIAAKTLQDVASKIENAAWAASLVGICYFGPPAAKSTWKYISLKTVQQVASEGQLSSPPAYWDQFKATLPLLKDILKHGLPCTLSTPKDENTSYTADAIWRLTVEPIQRIWSGLFGAVSGDISIGQAANIALINPEIEATCYEANQSLNNLKSCLIVCITLLSLRVAYNAITYSAPRHLPSSKPEIKENFLQEITPDKTLNPIIEEPIKTLPLSPEILQAIEAELQKYPQTQQKTSY